jgi:hypothetical protein
MASRKKHLEGIALLSMYNDDEEDDDEEMEDLEHQPNQSNDMEQDTLHDDNAMLTEEFQDTEEAEAAAASRNSTPEGSLLRPLTPLQQQLQQGGTINLETKRSSSRRGRLAIVDYGHDEVAMSPEPEVIPLAFKIVCPCTGFLLLFLLSCFCCGIDGVLAFAGRGVRRGASKCQWYALLVFWLFMDQSLTVLFVINHYSLFPC